MICSWRQPYMANLNENDGTVNLETKGDTAARIRLLYSAAIALALVWLFIALIHHIFHRSFHVALPYPWARPLVRLAYFWAWLELLLLTYKTWLWFRYHPVPVSGACAALPMTVVIPAYNEGPMVAKSIASVVGTRYPSERLEIIVVDDGSRDDTWEHIASAAGEHPRLVTAVRFPENRGKRAALQEGFKRARGEIVATIDSDSVIDADTLAAMAAPFRDPRVGAVAGKVVVHNLDQGLIPRMLQVAYILSFDFMRAAQSQYRTVYCCPGALAAYRVSVVRRVLDQWARQTFLGAACTYGEDRALTNYILEQGYDTVYQGNAIVHTVVPTRYAKLCKMFLRWDRSFVREEIRLAGIVWRRPAGARAVTLIDKIITNLSYPLRYAVGLFVMLLVLHHPGVIPMLLLGVGVSALLPALYYLRSEPSWNWISTIPFSYYSMFALWWIMPYAAVTVRARSWLTR